MSQTPTPPSSMTFNDAQKLLEEAKAHHEKGDSPKALNTLAPIIEHLGEEHPLDIQSKITAFDLRNLINSSLLLNKLGELKKQFDLLPKQGDATSQPIIRTNIRNIKESFLKQGGILAVLIDDCTNTIRLYKELGRVNNATTKETSKPLFESIKNYIDMNLPLNYLKRGSYYNLKKGVLAWEKHILGQGREVLIEESEEALELSIKDYRETAFLMSQNPPEEQDHTGFGQWIIYLSWIMREMDMETCKRVFEKFEELLIAMNTILTELLIEEQNTFAHYSSIETLQKLAENMHFRFYSALDMKDPQEGKKLFEAIKTAGFEYMNEIKDILDFESETPSLNITPYIGSFVIEKRREGGSELPTAEQRDRMDFWRSYGKDAEGCCLVFSSDVFTKENFLVVQHPTSLHSTFIGGRNDDSENKKKHYLEKSKLPIYRVSYEASWSKENKEGLAAYLRSVGRHLKEMKGEIDKIKNEKAREEVLGFVRDHLSGIRFLFKSKHYEFENEARVVILRPSHPIQHDSYLREDDESEKIPRRLYLEADDKFKFEGVVLGPRVLDPLPERWRLWLRQKKRVTSPSGKIIWVRKSTAPYVEN